MKSETQPGANKGGYSNWDLSSYFPAFDGPEYRAHRDELEKRFRELGERATALNSMTADNVNDWAALILLDEEITKDYSHLASYIGCLNSDDSNNEAYKREQARLAAMGAMYRKAHVPMTAALKNVADDVFEKLASHADLASARFSLERAREDARRSMEPALEMLNADLSVDGISAWGRLYNDVAGRLEFDLELPDGMKRRVPMAQKRTLLEDPDPAVRKAAMTGSNAAWATMENVAAAALNAIVGTRLTLNRHRGIDNYLDVAMFQSAVKQETIERMWDVVAKNRATPWKYLRRKSEILGKAKLGFQDLSAPLPLGDDRRFDWNEGVRFVLDAFTAPYPSLGDFAREMIEKRRVESELRAGKRPGAFCTSSYKIRESRVFMSYGGSLGDVQTLAHELGHAFHNYVMRDLRPMQRGYPMTLAETASTFAEDILIRALLDYPETSATLRAELLNTQLSSAAIYMLDIHMRYIFEKRLHEERAKAEVSVSRLKELMLEAERECFGDTINEDELDPLFWASKLHFYIVGVTFYNFPYTFGYLFSRGLSAMFQKEGREFIPKYESLLRLTGSDTAERVAERALGVDLTGEEFWQQAIDGIAKDNARFDEVMPQVVKK